jgi:DNA-binding GntR family transcriptional regulator
MPVNDAQTEQRDARAYRLIKEAIVDGGLVLGIPISERELAARLVMSRTPIRAALNRLCAEGLLRSQPGGGYCAVALSANELIDVYAVKGDLEALAARLCATSCTSVDIAHLASVLAELDRAHASGDDDAIVDANRFFHQAIVNASRNEYLQQLLQNVDAIVERYRVTAVNRPTRFDEAHAEHHAIFRAIADHSPQDADRLARAHWENALAARLKHLLTAQLHRSSA